VANTSGGKTPVKLNSNSRKWGFLINHF
jgi:hypothetical protein